MNQFLFLVDAKHQLFLLLVLKKTKLNFIFFSVKVLFCENGVQQYAGIYRALDRFCSNTQIFEYFLFGVI